ncbi:MAG TPA: DUF362 domain-containing protein [Candidatus Acidoferrum sp.]|nr:DUF362 domain-containing protein [Candidatus Acidoferrum sp.]
MSRVVVVKYNGAAPAAGLDADDYRLLLAAGLRTLAGTGQPKAAISALLPSGVIGMKTNCIARKLNSTPVPLVDALCSLLIESGYHDNDLVVWDRTCHELTSAGFTLNASSFGRRCLGTDTTGAGYSSEFYLSGEVSSMVTRIMTDLVTANINLPILKDHSIAGLSGGMKNMYGAINNPNKCHPNNCDPYCAHVSNLDPIRTKNKLIIIDAIRVQYHGGPGFVADYMYRFGGLIISNDPVAVDRVGLDVLEKIRALKGRPTLASEGRPVNYLTTAEKIGLGSATLSNIDLKILQIDSSGQESSGVLF